MELSSVLRICCVLSWKVNGLGLSTESATKDNFRLMAVSKLRSSMYFKEREDGLGMRGLSKAPLNLMIKSKIPSSAPCGVDPGNIRLEELAPLYLMYIDLSVR